VGEPLTRFSTIINVVEKMGRTGPLVFVTVRHEIKGGVGGADLTETQTLVYRAAAVAAATKTGGNTSGEGTELEPLWRRTLVPDPVLLFQYSAVTYNTHRIHYDRPYATEVEGYPGLVVHGPLIATLLMELVHKHTSDFAVADFTVRAVLPLFDNAPLELRGRADDKNFRLAALTSSSNLAMSIEGQFVDAVRRPTG